MRKKKTIYRWGWNLAVGGRFLRSPEVPATDGSSGPRKFRPSSGQVPSYTEGLHHLVVPRKLLTQGTEVPAAPEVPGDGSSGEVPGYTERLHEKCSFSGYPGSFPDLPVPGSSGLNRNMTLRFSDQCEKVSWFPGCFYDAPPLNSAAALRTQEIRKHHGTLLFLGTPLFLFPIREEITIHASLLA